jgi:hypothetical protein
MSEPIVVATPFADLGELAEHFAQRVDAGRLMLPYPTAVAEGEWAQFQVLYADGSIALEGTGKITGAYDNGEEHPPEYRFDIVIDELALDGTSEVVFERITVARDSMLAAEPGTGEVSIAELESAPPPAEEPGPEPEPEPEPVAFSEPPAPIPDAAEFDESEAAFETAEPVDAALDEVLDAGHVEHEEIEHTMAAPIREPAREPVREPMRAVAAPRANPRGEQPPPGKLPSPHSFSGGVLTRPAMAPSWEPAPEMRPDPSAGTGLFDYGPNGLPKPERAPRPELPDEARVGYAPAPEA